jgi:RNA polymerase sigma-70 factor (ECF subfamily)
MRGAMALAKRLLLYGRVKVMDHRPPDYAPAQADLLDDPTGKISRIGSMNGVIYAIGNGELDAGTPLSSRLFAFDATLKPIWVDPMTAAVEIQSREDGDPSDWIVAIAKDRSRNAFALTFARFAPRVKSYLLKLGCKNELAEELAQETLLTVWRKASYFDPARASASTWIFTIARNLRIDALRRERHPDDLLDEPALLPEPETPPDEVLSGSEREQRLRRALKTLPEQQAEVVRLSFFHDKAHAEISTDLGLPLGTVKSRLRLAMVRLRAQLEDLL